MDPLHSPTVTLVEPTKKEKSTLFKPSLYGGRMTRKQYWVRYFTFIMIGRIICNSFIETAFDLTEFIVSVILLLLFEIFYTLPITIKRYHDAGYSGSLAVWLAVISTIMLFLAIFTSPSSAVGVCSLLMCIILGIVNGIQITTRIRSIAVPSALHAAATGLFFVFFCLYICKISVYNTKVKNLL